MIATTIISKAIISTAMITTTMKNLVIKPLVLILITFVCFACATPPQKAPKPKDFSLSYPLKNADYASVSNDGNVAVSTVHPLATKLALNIAEEGGNAIDAALSAAFTLGVVDSHNSGIGGGCFILVRLASGEVLAIDGREMAPAKAHRDMYIVDGKLDKSLSKVGPLASGIPGSVMALDYLQKIGGKKKFADAVLPAADIAESGFPIDTTLARRLARTAENISKFDATAAIFLDKDGKPLEVGQKLIQADLAKSYRELAAQGPDWFYRGDFAKSASNWMAENNGIITLEDFKNYQIIKRPAVKSEFLGYEVYGFPPPSSGGVHVAQILNILSEFDLKSLSDAERYHLLAESMKLAFADRAYWLGDADFTPVPKGLISKSYAKKLAERIDLNRAAAVQGHSVPPNAAEDLFGKHTTHIATADKYGNWVAITTTLNTSFGSKVVVPGTGVLLNNQMDDFSAQPGVPNAFGLVGAEANAVAAGKRPLSSMSPTLVTKNGEPFMTLGAAGGPTIITQVLQTLVYKLALGRDIQASVGGARVHQQWRPDMIFAGGGVDDASLESLKQKGHQVRKAGDFGGTQAIVFEGGKLIPITEPRVIKRNNANR